MQQEWKELFKVKSGYVVELCNYSSPSNSMLAGLLRATSCCMLELDPGA